MSTSQTHAGNGETHEKRASTAAPKLGEADIGLGAKERAGSIQAMNVALANASLLTIKTKKFHWDVVGPQFSMLHKLWDDQYETDEQPDGPVVLKPKHSPLAKFITGASLDIGGTIRGLV